MATRHTDQVDRALFFANAEAQSLGHDGIGPEHLLLGILMMNGEPVTDWLSTQGVTPDSVRDRLIELVGRADEPSLGLGFTRLTSVAMDIAFIESLRLGHEKIDVEQLLLGIIDDEESLAVRILAEMGVKSDTIRAVLWMGVLEAASEVTGYLRRGDHEYAIKYASQMAEAAKEAATLFQAVLIGTQHYADAP